MPGVSAGGSAQDERGGLMGVLDKHVKVERRVEEGDRVGRLVIAPYCVAGFFEADELSATVRGGGGFGSTGTK